MPRTGQFRTAVSLGEHICVAPARGGDLAAVVHSVQKAGRRVDARPLIKPGLGLGVPGAARGGAGPVPVVVHHRLGELLGPGGSDDGLRLIFGQIERR
jgi:hypothetical protein